MFSMDANELQMHLFMMDRNGERKFSNLIFALRCTSQLLSTECYFVLDFNVNLLNLIIVIISPPESLSGAWDVIRVAAVGPLETRRGVGPLRLAHHSLLLYLLLLLLLLLLDCGPVLVDEGLDGLGVHHGALLAVGVAGGGVQGEGLQLSLLERSADKVQQSYQSNEIHTNNRRPY